VSKGYADFVILDSSKKCVEDNFQLDDTFQGHCHLYNKLQTFFDDHPDVELCAGVESTGGYENNWFNALLNFQESLPIKVSRLNPFGVNAESKAGLKRIITDKISAQSVAEYLITHPEKVVYEQSDQLATLRKQWSFVKMLTKQSTQMLNQLESLVYTANPEVLKYCQDGVPGWMFKLLKQYPTAAKLAKAKRSAVARIPYLSADRAEQLIKNAKNSVASSSDDITAQLVTATVKQICQLKETIKVQTNIMADHCSTAELKLLKTFAGIGNYSAIGLMLEIQPIARFSSVKKLSSFFGIHPVFKISGDGSSGFRMSKKGRRAPRQILFMVALTAIRTNPLIREIYQERINQGMEKMAAIGLCMHKILRIVYGMLKNKTAFDPEIDRKNRKRKTNPTKASKDKNRRCQDYDPGAPISRRQRKKREERQASQSAVSTSCGITTAVPELSS
jgi:transposase